MRSTLAPCLGTFVPPGISGASGTTATATSIGGANLRATRIAAIGATTAAARTAVTTAATTAAMTAAMTVDGGGGPKGCIRDHTRQFCPTACSEL